MSGQLCLIAKEAALFEQTMDQNLILIRLEEQTTTLSLLSKGKLASCEIIEQGIDQWSKALVERYELPPGRSGPLSEIQYAFESAQAAADADLYLVKKYKNVYAF